MPYPPEHKLARRQQILAGAYELFSLRGFDAVTIDEVMNHCGLTRGGFYAHFENKAELYREAIAQAIASSKLAKSVQSQACARERLTGILNGYLSLDHVLGNSPCPLAFLATDIALRDGATRQAFAEAYALANRRVWECARTFTDLQESDVLSLTAMVVGTVALARSMDSKALVESMLAAARRRLEAALGIVLD